MSSIPFTNSSMENVTSEVSAKVVTIVQILYGVPSCVLMILFFVVLQKGKTYSNSFYKIVQMDLLVNIFCWLNTWLALRLEAHPFGVAILKFLEISLPGTITACKFLTNFFFHMHVCSAIALSVHRITSVLYPIKYERWWSQWFILFCACCFVYSFLPILIPFPGISIRVSIVNGTLTKFKNSYALAVNANKIGIYCTLYFFVILVFGLATSFIVVRKMEEINVKDRRIGRKLTKIALTYASVYLGELVWSDLNALNNKFNFLSPPLVALNTVTMTFVSDSMTLALPYILMIYDTNIQKDILKHKASISGSQTATSSFVITTI